MPAILQIGWKVEHRRFLITSKPSSVSALYSSHTELLWVPLSMLSHFQVQGLLQGYSFCLVYLFCSLFLANFLGLNFSDASMEDSSPLLLHYVPLLLMLSHSPAFSPLMILCFLVGLLSAVSYHTVRAGSFFVVPHCFPSGVAPYGCSWVLNE